VSKTVRLRCVGSGDAFGSGGRLNSCFHLAAEGEQLLLDCGCSSLIGLQRCGLNPAELDYVVISHLHGDHFGGIPFLLLEGKYVSRRRRPLTLIGPADLQQQVEAALEALYPGAIGNEPGFPLIYRQLDPAQTLVAGGFEIGCCQVRHGNSKNVYGLRIRVAGKSLSYTGDTEWTDNLIALADGCELLIAECFAYDRPLPSHLDYQTLLQRRADLNCRRLVLTHLGAEMLQQRNALQFTVLNDGDLIEL
jgi:ribonuclease BN (tRNA processing enzyme)